MKPVPRWIKWTIGGAAARGIGYAALSAVYLGPRARLQAWLGYHRGEIAYYEGELARRQEVRDRLEAFAAGTLGGALDKADHRFRTSLTSIAEECGLSTIQVSSRQPVPALNPVVEARLPAGDTGELRTLKNELKKKADFYAIGGELKASGTLEQVLRATAVVQAQPWVHRTDRFILKPDKNGDRFDLQLGVVTLLAPDLAEGRTTDPVRMALADTAAAAWAPAVAKNVFKEPPPEAPAPPVQVATTSAGALPPPPPYADWKLTGILESRLGVEALLVNVRSGQHVTLAAGASVVEARFVAGSGERAVFEIGGQRFEVANGQTLEQRRPLNE